MSGIQPLESGDPAVMGGYRLLGRLGEGGMGVVYLAGKSGARVAVKTMRWSDLGSAEARERFRAEARCARLIDCAFTPGVLDDRSGTDFPHLVTEYVSGPSLAQAVERTGPLDPPDALAVAVGVAEALTRIHAAGVVHRDIKPGNVLLAESGPRVIDFGIAETPGSAGLTQTGMVMGSPGWVAPERLRGVRATAASDVFCWGMLVAYAVTGRHPFGDSGAHLADRIMSLEPDLRDVGEPFRGVVTAALAKDPAARPAAADLRQALLEAEASATKPFGFPQRLPLPAATKPAEPRRRSSLRMPAAAALVAAAVLAAGFVSLNGPTNTTPPAAAAVPAGPAPTVTVTRAVTPRPARAARPARRPQAKAAPADSRPSAAAAAPAAPAPEIKKPAKKKKKTKTKKTN